MNRTIITGPEIARIECVVYSYERTQSYNGVVYGIKKN